MTSAAKRPTKDELNEATARTAGLMLRSQAEEIDMKSMAMVVGTLMASLACAATGQVQPAADVAASNVTAATNLPAVANEASDVKDPNKIRCERMAVTGSRLGGKVCHTEADWARIEQRSDELVRDINSQFVAPPDPFRHTADYVPNPMGGG